MGNGDSMPQTNVGLGKIAIVRSPHVLVSVGVGSCVILCLYHEQSGTAGMAHIMLGRTNSSRTDPDKPAKFAELAVDNLLKEFARKGIKEPSSLQAKIVGGAQLFIFKQVPNIGDANVEAVKEALDKYGIPIVASDVGGTASRSVWFYAETGKVIVRSRREIKREL